jgi:multidrug resistance efflux pump
VSRLRVLAALLVAGVGATAAWIVPRATATVVTVAPGPVQPRVVARAVVAARAGVAKVRARIDGRVLAVHVREGDPVRSGQLLAELESDTLGSEVARRDAEQRAAEASARGLARGSRSDEIALAEAERTAAAEAAALAVARARRATQLLADRAISAQDQEDAARSAAIAAARLKEATARASLVRKGARSDEIRAARELAAAAGAALEAARHQLDHTRLVAPIDGVVLARRVDPGDTLAIVAPQPPLFEIADVSRTEVRAEVEEADAHRVAVGQAVELRTLDGARVAAGKIARVAARCERRTIDGDAAGVRADGLVRAVWIDWDEPPARATPIGQRLEALIGMPPRAAAARVPRRAVRVEGGAAVVALRQGLLVETRTVEVEAMDEEWVELRGVAAGETLVLP